MPNRDIKFRGWYQHNKRMIYESDFDEQGLYGSRAEFFRRAGINGYKLMQFTGLKDKNGKEVYEGDIVRATEPKVTGGGTTQSDVIEDQYDTSWSVRTVGDGSLVYTHGLHLKHFDTIEVVGNIYQNPELLK